MGNVLRILGRDIMRLLRTPQAITVLCALMVLPSAYTWYNVRAFWNPYENTGNLGVAVVNLDAGGESELTGHLDVGAQIVDTLHENTQLKWEFDTLDDAFARLESGEVFAAFVIPEDFTSDLLSITTGDFHKPDIDYYVNEKMGAVGPKVTDSGATTLEEQVNSTFVTTVSEAAVNALDEALSQADERKDAASSAASAQLADALADIGAAREGISRLVAVADDMSGKVSPMQDALSVADSSVDSAAAALDEVATLAAELAQELNGATSGLAPATDELAGDTLASLKQSLDSLAATARSASANAESQHAMIGQARNLVADLGDTLGASKSALRQTDSLLQSLSGELETVQSDVIAIRQANILSTLLGEGDDGQSSLNAQRIADFIGAPTQIVTEQLYPSKTYGTSMAPLFMNLTFWIGAFMLMVVMRQEVDAEGIPNITLTQRYLGRFALFAIIVLIQASVCCLGLPLLGVEVESLPALVFAACVASLTYLSIIYALSVCLQHIGKGICIVLVFMQIPAATGLYPIEMTAPFFQAIYPLLPFTYGISAMREAICGFYGSHYLNDTLALGAFFAAFMAAGIIVRPYTSNVNRMVARKVHESGIYAGEDVEVPARRFKLSQVVRALSDREAYTRELAARYERFESLYPKLIKGSAIIGIAAPIAFTVIFSLNSSEKIVLLAAWMIWLVAVFVFLIVVESIRASIERQLRLDGMSDEELRDLYRKRNSTERMANDE